MKTAQRILLWTGVAGAIPLPILSNVGYLPFKIEYIIAALSSLLLGTVCAWAARFRYAGIFLLLALTTFTTSLYFGYFIYQYWWLFSLFTVFAAGFAFLTLRDPDKALMLTGFVAFAQIIGTAAATPTSTISLKEFPVAHSDLPPVIHLMLDEHPGMAAFPSDAVSPKEIADFQDNYVKHGFIVFTHAYTADRGTPWSLSRLFNINSPAHLPDSPEPLQHASDFRTYWIVNSSVFSTIAKDRAIDMTQVKYVNFDRALNNTHALARNLTYNMRDINSIDQYSMPLNDRLTLAMYLTLSRLYTQIHSPVIRWFINHTDRSLAHNLQKAQFIFAFSSRFILHQMTERLSCCGERGTYYFAHLLLPHFNYILDKDCHPLPISEWHYKHHPHNKSFKAELADRRTLYKLDFGQSTCAAHDVFNLVDALNKNKEMSDAVILLHSDHGSRIVIDNFMKHKNQFDSLGYNKSISDRDWYGSFIAIKIPGMEGRIIDTPVRLDTFYNNLLENHFTKLDFNKLIPLKDSPYKP